MSPLTPSAPRRRGVRAALRPRLLVPVAVVAACAVTAPVVLSGHGSAGDVDAAATLLTGWPADRAPVRPAQLAAMTLHLGTTPLADVHATLDDHPVPVTASSGAGGTAALGLGHLADGRHTLVLDVAGRHLTRTFLVDGTPPAVSVQPVPATTMGRPLALRGTVEAGAKVTVNGTPATVSGGTWSASFPAAPAQVQVVATDAAGNATTKAVAVKFAVPLTRAVHMTALAWSYPPKRNAVLALARAHRITAVEVDIKDEDGLIGYRSAVPLAVRTGAAGEAPYDAKKMLAQLHALHVRVIGRLVAFHDPKLGAWAWKHGHRTWVLQDRHGRPWQGSYGSYAFTNFANPHVQQYNIDIAVEAAKLGFDDILYDYVRRADGRISDMRIPGVRGDGEAQVADFVRRTRAALDAAGVHAFLGASVFGESATRPREIAQNITMIGRYADYVSPMVYPSHWNRGEYGVPNPNAMPYPIVNRSLKDFQKRVTGTGAVVIPWLQAFSLGVTYSPSMVRAQERAAHDDGISSFLLWNATCDYPAATLPVVHR